MGEGVKQIKTKPPTIQDPPHLGTAAAILALLGTPLGLVADKFGMPVLGPFLVWFILTVVAVIYLADPGLRLQIVASLRDAQFTQVYRRIMSKPIEAIWGELCDPSVPKDAGFGMQLRGALTWKVYDVALLLALAYPILSIVVWWVANGLEGKLGQAVLLPNETTFLSGRAASMSCIVLVLLGPSLQNWAKSRQGGLLRATAVLLPDVSLPGAFAFSGAIAVAVIVAYQAAFAGHGALFILAAAVATVITALIVAVLFKFAGAAAFAFTFAWIIWFVDANPVAIIAAIAIAVGGAALDVRAKRPQLARLLITVSFACYWIVAARYLNWAQWPEAKRSIFVFLSVFPLVNAVVDVLSYAATLALIRIGLSTGMPVLLGVIDLVVALVLFLALGALLVSVITGLNHLAGSPLLNLGELFARIQESWRADGPMHIRAHMWDYAWVYTMLFSSALPTAIHLIVSLTGLQVVIQPSWRLKVANWIESGSTTSGTLVFQTLVMSTIWFVPIALAGLIIVSIWWVGAQTGVLGVLAKHYFEILIWTAGREGAF